MDNGFPMTTEPNILKEMILSGTVTKVLSSVTGASTVSSQMPEGAVSHIPWRKTGVKVSGGLARR